MWSMLSFLVFAASTQSQEVTTPGYDDRNYNIALEAAQYLKNLNIPGTTKQGPVLFPNDAPPPPRPPLIVTSRPLLESISRSDLNPLPQNSSVAESQNRVSFIPNYLGRVKQYKPFGFLGQKVPYADVVEKFRVAGDNRFDHYEERTVLPPIYKALADHAQENVLKTKNKGHLGDYKVKESAYPIRDYLNDQTRDDNYNNDPPQDYAFSYAVKDHKTGDDFSHSQQSSGSATNGEYRVRLPDGRMQIVSYTADENGYKADVRYDDENHINDGLDQNYHTKYQKDDLDLDNNNRKVHHDNPVNFENDNYDNIETSNVKPQNNIPINYNQNNDYDKTYQNYDFNSNERDFKANVKDYYNYPDISKEYYNDDYSSEFNSNYPTHRSKFSSFAGVDNQAPTASTVKPTYEELKDLFVNKNIYKTEHEYNNNNIQVEINVPSTTPDFSMTTERVVVIGNKPNLYTSIRSPTITPFIHTPIVATTPRNYLVSTITNLRNKIDLINKPVLSNRYIDKINKYLSFT